LSEEELALFDLLTKPDMKLSKSQRKCSAVFQHVYDSYFGQTVSLYATAA